MIRRDRATRAASRRAHAVLRKARLERRECDLDPVRGVEAISLVHRLTLESWSLGRLPVPEYSRGETPYRFVRSHST